MSDAADLPHDEQSERAVLVAVLLEPSLLALVAGRLTAEDFYLEKHQILYSAVVELQNKQVSIDLRAVHAHLEQKGQLEGIGGLAYLATLYVDLPDLGRVDTHAELVKERSVRRRLIQASSEIIRDCYRQDDGSLLARIRTAVADYKGSEGCSCCRDVEEHWEHERVLAELLGVPACEDGGGYDFGRFRSGQPTTDQKEVADE